MKESKKVREQSAQNGFQDFKVMKFGGTSVGTPEKMQQVAQLVLSQKQPVIVVLSALSGTTNALSSISALLAEHKKTEAKETIVELEVRYRQFISGLLQTEAARQKAESVLEEHFEFLNIILKISYSASLSKDILAQGELLSTRLFSILLDELTAAHRLLPALEFMSVDEQGEPRTGQIKVLLSQLLDKHSDKCIFVTQGYICRNAKGEIDNLNRGGSDYTASLIAGAIGAAVCEIWTDINGMHNNDPRIVENTRPVEQLSFNEAAELAYFGAKILHPSCIWPAQLFRVPVRLLNTMEPEAKGTIIEEKADHSGLRAIAAKDGIIAIKIRSSRMLLAYGFLKKVFEVFEKYKTPIDMVTTSEVAISVTIDSDLQLSSILQELEPFCTVSVDYDQTIVALVGNEIAATAEILQRIFTALNDIPVRMVSYGGSKDNISLLIPSDQKAKTLQLLNKALF